MPLEIQTVMDAIGDNGIKILVLGPAGAGKTVLCATTGEKTIIISAEAGLLSLKKYAEDNPEAFKKIRVVTVKNMNDFADSDDQLCDWLCLDSISEIAEQILSEEKESAGRDPRKAYGELQDKMAKLLRAFRDLDGYNVVMTAKQELIRDGDTDRTMYRPMLPGQKLPQAIPYMFDEVFALRVEHDEEDDSSYRILQTGKDYKYEAKDRSGVLDMFEPPNLKKVADKIHGKKSTKSKKEK